MDGPRAIQVLFLDPEGAADAAIRLLSVPEGANMILKNVMGPSSPTHELAFGAHKWIGDVRRRCAQCVAQKNRPSDADVCRFDRRFYARQSAARHIDAISSRGIDEEAPVPQIQRTKVTSINEGEPIDNI